MTDNTTDTVSSETSESAARKKYLPPKMELLIPSDISSGSFPMQEATGGLWQTHS